MINAAFILMESKLFKLNISFLNSMTHLLTYDPDKSVNQWLS